MNRKHEDLCTIHTEQKRNVIFGIFQQVLHTLETFLAANCTIHITITITVTLLCNNIVVEYNLFFVVYPTAFGISISSTHQVT